jgi:predicted deacetylase
MKLVVSLHDVSPLTQVPFAAMLAELEAWGVGACSLLVIPDHHGRGNMRDDPAFCGWLEGLARRGHELVVHGYEHRRPARATDALGARLLTQVYTQGEGEFYDLGFEAAERLLARSLRDFEQLDAPHPQGFIAPAWLLGAEAERAVAAAGFRYTTRLTEVKDLQTGAATRARSLVYSCRNGWRRACSLAWNGALAGRLRHAALMRLSLHPPDFAHPAIWRQVQRIVREAVSTREPITYEAWVRGESLKMSV